MTTLCAVMADLWAGCSVRMAKVIDNVAPPATDAWQILGKTGELVRCSRRYTRPLI
jgi:hypothetical protein